MLHPDTYTISERVRLRHGADMPCQVEHVQHDGLASQQAILEVRELRCLEAQPATGGCEAGWCQRTGHRAADMVSAPIQYRPGWVSFRSASTRLGGVAEIESYPDWSMIRESLE